MRQIQQCRHGTERHQLQEHRLIVFGHTDARPQRLGIIPDAPQDTRIVFTTAFDQYALDGFKVNALDYLLKPINYNEFLTASRKAFEWFELKHQANPSREEDFIYVKSDYKLVQIRLEDILYIEGLKDYLKIYTENDPRPVLTLISMKSMEERLPSPRFMRVHRSYIVQMNKVKTLDKGQIIFGKTRIPISDTYKQILRPT